MEFSELVRVAYSRLKAINSPLLKKSEVFCMAPWIQLYAQTNGKVAPCCMSTIYGGNELGDLKENSDLRDSWNSENMKQLRLNMLNGKKSTLCTHCYDYEKVGKFSERMQYNKDFKRYYSRVTGTLKDGEIKDKSIPLIDIRFSNKCNYKCRICDSVYSSLWYDEEQKIGKTPGLPSTKIMNVSGDETHFWESYEHLLPEVKRLHFAGGEPLIMDDHYRALEYLISIGKADVTLSYNTNFSTLKYKKYDLISLWNKFKRVDVWASLDGMGAKGDYQRKGQQWKKIEENIRQIQRQCPTVFFGVNVTVSIFNILDIPEFYQYMVDSKLVLPDKMNLYLLFDPPYFNITNLTLPLKEKVTSKLKKFETDYLSSLTNNANINNHLNAVITFMKSEQGHKQNEFRHWVTEVDKLRNEKFLSIFPELEEMMVIV